MTATATPAVDQFQMLHVDDLIESPKNPRKHFDQTKLAELAKSIATHGVLTPLLARENVALQRFEVAAGHRRFRAAKLVGVTELPVVVRDMTDVELLEVLTIENLQRDDVHPLEEAQGFQDLMFTAGYTAERIADRIGKSAKYVYDRVKLLRLSDELKELFFDRKIEAGHAIILARLSAADQKRAVDYQHGGLWTHEDPGQTDLAEYSTTHELTGFGHVKPRTVRELQGWVNDHVRFTPEGVDPVLFPEAAVALAPALEAEEKIVAISHSRFVHPTAKDPDGARTYGPETWKRADGKEKSKACDRSAIGIVVVGDGRGDTFRVCVDKMRCKTHWGAEIAAREKAAKAATASSSKAPAGPPKKQPWEIENEKRVQRKKEWEAMAPQIMPVFVAYVKKAPAGGRSLLAQLLVSESRIATRAATLVPRSASAEDLVRHLAFGLMYDAAVRSWDGGDGFRNLAKSIGFDVDKAAKALATEKAPAKKQAPKKKARR